MHAKRIAAVFLFSFFYFGAVVSAQELQKLNAFALGMLGKPLAGVAVLESCEAKDRALQETLAMLRSFAGDWHGAHLAADGLFPKQPVDAILPDDVSPLSALDTIVNQAKSHRIVIINESHHVPQHRAFILNVLRKLRAQGFQYYAAETLSGNTQALSKRGYPVHQTGVYTNESVFGDLVREALAMGYQPVAYEAKSDTPFDDPIDGINAREAQQCRNLVDRVFVSDADAKVIVHVGFDHAMEQPRKVKDGREILWLAARLAKETSSDPLTIDQTTHTERGDASLLTPQWQQANKNAWLEQPVILARPDGTFEVTGHFAKMVDMQVLHPATKLVDGRPDWLAATGRTAVAIPEEVRADSARVLVQAFISGEREDAIPLDQLILTPGQPRPKLLLRPGNYRLVVQDESGEEVLRLPLVCEKN